MVSDQFLQIDPVRPLSGNSVSRETEGFEMEIDGIRKMALQIIEKGAAHINDADRWMGHKRSHFRRLNEFWEVYTLKRQGLGFEMERKKKEEQEEDQSSYRMK